MKSYIRIYLLVALSAVMATMVNAQIDSSRLYYDMYEEAMDSAEYTDAILNLSKALKYEAAKENPDKKFLGDIEYTMGTLYEGTDYAYVSYPAFLTSIQDYTDAGLNDLSLRSYSHLPKLFSRISSKELPLKEEGLGNDNEKDTIGAFFKVLEVLPQENPDGSSGDMHVRIRAGLNQGVFVGSKGGILSGSNDSLDERENTVLGDAEVIEVYSHSSLVKINFYTGMSSYGVIADDLVKVQIEVADSLELGVFNSLLTHDIIMTNLSGEPFYSPLILQYKSSKHLPDLIKRSILAHLVEVGEMILNNEDFNSNKPESGKYKGVNWPEALMSADMIDVENFLDYMSNYPFSYMGKDFAFANVYATWMDNGTNATGLDGFKEKLISEIKALPHDETRADEYSSTYLFYLNEVVGSDNNYLNELYDNYKDEPALTDSFISKIMWMSKGKSDTLYNNMLLMKGYLRDVEKDHEESSKYFTQLIENGLFKETGYWYRSGALFELGDYKGVVDDCDSIIALGDSSWIPFAQGTKGAALFRMGEWKKAKPLFWASYQEDIYNPIKTMNVGISHLFSGIEDSAKHYFDLGFERMSYKGEYEALEDAFEYNISKGWMESLSMKYQSYLKDKWEDEYKMKVMSDEHWELSQTAYKLSNFDRAIAHLDTALYAEHKNKEINYRDIRAYHRWSAFCYYKLKDYDSSLHHYQKALKVNQSHIKDEALMVDDFDDVGNLYSWLDDDLNENIYDGLEYGLAHKLKMDTFRPKLYLLGISNSNDQTPFNYCHKDVEDFFNAIDHKHNKLYSSVNRIHLKNRSKSDIQQTFRELASNVSNEDVLIIHLAGNSYNINGEKGLVLESDSISLKRLFTNLSYVNADQILAVADIPGVHFVEEFVSFKNRLNFDQDEIKNFQILCPADVRMENPESKNSSFIMPVLESLEDTGRISTQDLGWALLQDYTLKGPRLAVSSYQTGRPFDIFNSDTSRKKAPVIKNVSLTRGVIAEDFGDFNTGGSQDYALLFATNEYDQWGDLNNPINDARALEKVLTEHYGFKVELVINATQREVMRKITEYKKKEFNSNDQLLIYFAGHGYYDEQEEEAYLVCKNSILSDEEEEDGYPSYLHYSYLNSAIGQMRSCKNVFMIMDVCFGGTFFDSETPSATYKGVAASEIDQLINNKRGIQTRIYLTSGNKEYVPDGRPGANSPFSSKLIQALNERAAQNGKPKDYVTMEDIVSYMHGLTTKVRYGSFGIHKQNGDFIFEYKADDALEGLQQLVGN
ncbi:MAG: caspase family protein [Bacteroidia bacterium]